MALRFCRLTNKTHIDLPVSQSLTLNIYCFKNGEQNVEWAKTVTFFINSFIHWIKFKRFNILKF